MDSLNPSTIASMLVRYIIVAFVVVSLSFFLVRLMPGSPLDYLSGEATDVPFALSEEVKNELVRYYGLDKPLVEQYLTYMKNILVLNLGYSIHYSEPVITVLGPALMRTLILVSLGFLLALSVALPLSAVSSLNEGSSLDLTMTLASVILYSIPAFALALVFLVIFSVKLKLFPLLGYSLKGDVISLLGHAIPPAIVLSFTEFGQLYYFTRNSFLNIIPEDYVLFARAKGLRESSIFLKYILRNALPPILSKISLILGYSILSCMFVERVFSYPGITWLLLNAYDYYDFPVLQAIFLIFMLSVISLNLIADLVSALIDPRLRGKGEWS